MLAGCDWLISIRSVDNMYDWRIFWKRFRGCFVFDSRVSTKTVVTVRGFNKEGWFYERGKGPSEELKGQIIDKILEPGGDRILGYFPAKWTKLGDKFGVSDYHEPSRVNPSFRSPLQARGGIFWITWHYFSDHMTRIEPLRIQIFNGSFTTLLILIVAMCQESEDHLSCNSVRE